jgi:hypothetical protein
MPDSPFTSDQDQCGVGFYLNAAQSALNAGQARLAIHLYYAAFELDNEQCEEVSADVIAGMRIAWNLACELRDRSTAESLFNELEPFNSEEQNIRGALRLQSMALGQLESIGFTADQIAGASKVLTKSPEADADIERGTFLESLSHMFGAFTSAQHTQTEGKPRLQSSTPDNEDGRAGIEASIGQLLESAFSQIEADDDDHDQKDGEPDVWHLDYDHLVGFSTAQEKMGEFGFFSE